MRWLAATVLEIRDENPSARTITFDVAGWPGHVAGQHLDLRLTTQAGDTAVRSYWLASAADGPVEVTVVEVRGGAVSPGLVRALRVGASVEVRGPLGGWFVWRPGLGEPVQLVGGDSGVIPLTAMLRTRRNRGDTTPMRLLYWVSAPGRLLYGDELSDLTDQGHDLRVLEAREAPDGLGRTPRGLDTAALEAMAWPASLVPTLYVSGPAEFVAHVGGLLRALGHDDSRIRSERFPT